MKIDNKRLEKIIKIFIVVVGVISLIPLMYLAGFDFATGDDLGYSANVRQTWIATHSLLSCLSSAVNHVKMVYNTWQGTWFTVFLFQFNPELLGVGFYAVVPIIMIAIQVETIVAVVRHFLKKRFKMTWLDCDAIATLILLLFLQFIPYPTCGMFWWTGSVHYVIPFALCLLAIVYSDKYSINKKTSNYIVWIICMILLGGCSYQAAILAPIVSMIIMLWRRIVLKDSRIRFSLWILIPFVAEFVGLKISAAAPGNTVRGGENFGFSFGKVLTTILESFLVSLSYIKEYFVDKMPMFAIFIIIGIILWWCLRDRVTSNDKDSFRCPVLFLIMSYCVFAATFAPQIFAGVDVSGGVYNTYLYVFVLCVVSDIAYLEGYVLSHFESGTSARRKTTYYIVLLTACLVFIYQGRHSIKETTDYVCYKYIISGQAHDYKAQMILQNELLMSDEKEVVVPMINDEQGPFQCMPITENNDNFTNYVARNYYGKDSVIAIPREEWNEIYGSSY